MNVLHKDSRIAIIGAGPAGLGAAIALRENGYRSITVFEKSPRVGGMALSCVYTAPDQRRFIYDVGSVQPLSSGILLRLLKEYGLSFGRGPLQGRLKSLIARDYSRRRTLLDFVRHYFGVPGRDVPRLFLDLLKLGRYLFKYRRLRAPGFYQFAHWKETSLPFSEWVAARRFYILGERLPVLMNSLMSFSNKNKENEVPAFMALKFLHQMLKSPMRYIDGSYLPVAEGYQELWKRVAEDFDVRLSTPITAVLRDSQGVHISTPEGRYDFDKLILACPFDKISTVMDADPEEQALFADVRYFPGFRGAFIAQNGPTDGLYWFPESYASDGEPLYLALILPEAVIDEKTCLYSCAFAHYPEQNQVVQALQRSAEDYLQRHFSAEITEWVQMQYWPDYGAYFGEEAVQQGVYDQIEARQGCRHTYYTGQLISFGTHACAVDYSFDMIKRFFNP